MGSGVFALDNQMLELLRQVEVNADDHKETLTNFAKDEKTLADNLRNGTEAAASHLLG